jgi:hypothetical protein
VAVFAQEGLQLYRHSIILVEKGEQGRSRVEPAKIMMTSAFISSRSE